MAAVLDLDAGDAIEHLIVADIDVVAHADINRGILDAREDVVFNQPFSPNSGKMPYTPESMTQLLRMEKLFPA